jgi:hypothetical protein
MRLSVHAANKIYQSLALIRNVLIEFHGLSTKVFISWHSSFKRRIGPPASLTLEIRNQLLNLPPSLSRRRVCPPRPLSGYSLLGPLAQSQGSCSNQSWNRHLCIIYQTDAENGIQFGSGSGSELKARFGSASQKQDRHQSQNWVVEEAQNGATESRERSQCKAWRVKMEP